MRILFKFAKKFRNDTGDQSRILATDTSDRSRLIGLYYYGPKNANNG